MSSSRKKAAKKTAKKRGAKKVAKKAVAKKRGAKQATKKSVKRRAAPRRAKKVAAKRRVAPKRKAAAKRKAAPKRKAATRRKTARRARAPRPTARPKLKVVRPPKAPKAAPAPPEPQAFAAAKANASAKDLMLFELVRARVALAAAIQGMGSASAEVPTEPGKWSTREMVLHLAYWDRECLPLLEDAYQHGKNSSLTHEIIQERNPVGIEELRHHDWDSARRLLQLHREKLMEEFQSIPEEPAEIWTPEHPVGKLARILTHHDRHHADKLKAARTSRGE